VLNIETNTIIELYDATFDKTTPYSRDVFVRVGGKKMEESIFIDEELHGFDGDEDEPLQHLHHHLSLFLLPHFKKRLLRLLPLPQQ
jgi:hypothetical protein